MADATNSDHVQSHSERDLELARVDAERVVDAGVGDHRLGREQIDDPAVDVQMIAHADRLDEQGSAIPIRTSCPTVTSGVLALPK